MAINGLRVEASGSRHEEGVLAFARSAVATRVARSEATPIWPWQRAGPRGSPEANPSPITAHPPAHARAPFLGRDENIASAVPKDGPRGLSEIVTEDGRRRGKKLRPP